MQRRLIPQGINFVPASTMKTLFFLFCVFSSILQYTLARHASHHDVINDVNRNHHQRHVDAKEYAHQNSQKRSSLLHNRDVRRKNDAENSDFSRTKELDYSDFDPTHYANAGRRENADYSEYDPYFQGDESARDAESVSWGRYDSPWEAPLFQWMKYPSLSHRPLSKWTPRAVHRDDEIHGASRRASRERDLKLQHQGAHRDHENHGASRSASRAGDLKHHPDNTNSLPLRASQPLTLSRRRDNEGGDNAGTRHHGHAERTQHPPRPLGLSRRPEADDEVNSGDDRRRSPHQLHGHRGLRQHTQPPTESSDVAALLAEIRQHPDGDYDGRTDRRAEHSRPHSLHNRERHHQEANSGDSNSNQDPRRGINNNPGRSLNSFGDPLSSLPHTGDEIVYKLPSETDARHQPSPISHGRRGPPVSRDFLVLDRLNDDENDEERGASNRRRPDPDHFSPRSRLQTEESRSTVSGFRGSNPEYLPSTARPDDSDRRRILESMASLHNADRHDRRYDSSQDMLALSGDGDDVSSGARRSRPHHQGQDQGRRHQGHHEGHRGEGRAESSSCGRDLETCRQTEVENRLLQRTYQKNLESLKRVLTEGLNQMIASPTQLIDRNLCDVIEVASYAASQRHDITRSDYAARQTSDRVLIDDDRRQSSRLHHDHSRTRHGNSQNIDDEDDDDDDDAFTDLRKFSEDGIELVDATDDNSDDFVIDQRVPPIEPSNSRRQDHRQGQGQTGRTNHHGHVTLDSSRRQRGRVSSRGVDDGVVDDNDDNDDEEGEEEEGEEEDSGELDVGDNNEEDAQKVWRSWKQQKQEEMDHLSEECRLGPWTDWSSPLGFGVIERRRFPLAENEKCKEQAEQAELVMRVDISVFNSNHTYYKAPEEVGQDFEADFTRSVKPRDLLLVLDASGSIEEEDFELMREGVDVMVSLFCGGFGSNANNNRLAILVFASEIQVVHRFSDDQSQETLRQVIANMSQPNGNTCTGDALKLAREVLFGQDRGSRPGVAHDTLIVTDGHSNCGDVTIQEGAQLLQNVSNVFALGVGIANDTEARWELNSVVSNSNPRHIFSLARFQDFKDMLESIEDRQETLPCFPIIDTTTTAVPDRTREG
ncbi:sarcoplasmic reticulum histidine-rich calcium-binding protein-like isoform X2 [Littorina saxatilis]|uniref:VWFA domain-containing protein n=2 Tax=Littorina saxatilis TaxID=31220 RepID=A0AAN9G5R4_9CAEN